MVECQRYYQIFGKKTNAGYFGTTLICCATHHFVPLFNYHVPMRIIPSIKINGEVPGTIITFRNTTDNTIMRGKFDIWNNSFNDRLNIIMISDISPESIAKIGSCYEASIELLADL